MYSTLDYRLQSYALLISLKVIILHVLVSDNNRNNMNVSSSTSSMASIDDIHSITCPSYETSTGPAATATADCVNCQTLKSHNEKLQKQLALKNRLLCQLRGKHKAFLRKFRNVSKEKLAVGDAVNTFLNEDQQKALSNTSRRGRKFSQKGILVLHKRTHAGEKPFSSSFCVKSFSQINIIVTHGK